MKESVGTLRAHAQHRGVAPRTLPRHRNAAHAFPGQQTSGSSQLTLPVQLGRLVPSNAGQVCQAAPSRADVSQALTGQTLTLPAGSKPSQDLQELCTMQLGLLYQMLSKVGDNYKDMKATVYSRSLEPAAVGTIQLNKVVAFPPLLGSELRGHPGRNEALILQAEKTWLLQGTSAAISPDASLLVEDCLVHQELVSLPNSGTLVLPLTDSSVLVGLLVVDVPGKHSSRQGSSDSYGDAAAAAAGASGSSKAESESVILLPEVCAAPYGDAQQQGAGMTEEELRCLRLATPLLAKSCAMDLRTALSSAQNIASMAAQQSLLRQLRRPLSALNTFGSMLVPRLKEGEMDRDMAKGILVQGKRLQDLLWQMEDALHSPSQALPAVPSTGRVAAPPASPPSAVASPARESVLMNSQASSMPAPAVTALPSPSIQTVDQLFQSNPSVSSSTQVYPAAMAAMQSMSGASPEASQADARATSVLASVASVSMSSQDIDSPTSSPGSLYEAASTSKPRQPQYVAKPTARVASGQRLSSATTIDMEVEGSQPRRSMTRSTSSAGSGPSGRPGHSRSVAAAAAAATATAAEACNLVSTLTNILTAAYKLAAANSINFIVSSPLHVVPPNARGSGGTASLAGSAPQSTAASSDVAAPSTSSFGFGGARHGGAQAPQLLPRPARPLLVGVKSGLVQRIVGYVLDIAVQCTPKGGQVCVSARQEGSGVQLVVQHTGRLAPSRLHTPTGVLPRAMCGSQPGWGQGAVNTAAVPAEVKARTSVAMAERMHMAVAPQAPGGMSGASGSGLLSVEMAQQLAEQVGGHLSMIYPCNMVNASSGSMDVGTSVEIWLPAGAAA